MPQGQAGFTTAAFFSKSKLKHLMKPGSTSTMARNSLHLTSAGAGP
jgi:hypothetical protein